MKKSFVKEGVLRLLAVMFAMMVILGSFKLSVSATNNIKYFTLNLNQEFMNFSFTGVEQFHYLSVTLPSDGDLKIVCRNDSVSGKWDDISVKLYNKDATGDYYLSVSPERAKGAQEDGRLLSKGEYTLVVYDEPRNAGTYQIKALFTPAGNNEKEPNNYFDTAMELSAGQEVKGLVCVNDQKDYYKFTLSQPQKIRLYFSAEKNTHFSIHDVDTLRQWGTKWFSGESYIDKDLPAGTNYIIVENDVSSTYKIRWEAAPIPAESVSITGSGEVAVGSTVGLTANVLPVDTTDKSVTWSSSNTNIASVDGNGIVRGVNVGIARIYAVTNDGSNKTAEFDIVVKPKKIEKVKAKAKGRKNVKVSWKKHKSVSDYQIQFCKNKKFKSGVKTRKVNGYELKNAEVRAPKKGTFYVRVRGNYYANGKTYHGDWSKPVKVKVK